MKDFNLDALEVTHVQLFDYAIPDQLTDTDFNMIYSYSANIVINDCFIVQVSGNKELATFDGVTSSTECFWSSEDIQDEAYSTLNDSELLEALENAGFENNIGWLEDNADEVFNPENAKYRR